MFHYNNSLQERATMLPYAYIACLVSDTNVQLVHYLRPSAAFPASLNIGQKKLFKIIVTSAALVVYR
jgi:hypothetical protein